MGPLLNLTGESKIERRFDTGLGKAPYYTCEKWFSHSIETRKRSKQLIRGSNSLLDQVNSTPFKGYKAMLTNELRKMTHV